MRISPLSPTKNRNTKMYNFEISTNSNLLKTNVVSLLVKQTYEPKKKIDLWTRAIPTIFDTSHVIPYGIIGFHSLKYRIPSFLNCVHLCSHLKVYCFSKKNID